MDDAENAPRVAKGWLRKCSRGINGWLRKCSVRVNGWLRKCSVGVNGWLTKCSVRENGWMRKCSGRVNGWHTKYSVRSKGITQKLVVTTTQVVTRIIGFLQDSRYKGNQNAWPEITALGACKKLSKLLQMNHHALLYICDCVALFFVHMNSVVLPNDS